MGNRIANGFYISNTVGVAHCLCCGAPSKDQTLRDEFACDCDRDNRSVCFSCLKCRKHCTCNGGPVSFEDILTANRSGVKHA
jgi:hypothetical protein